MLEWSGCRHMPSLSTDHIPKEYRCRSEILVRSDVAAGPRARRYLRVAEFMGCRIYGLPNLWVVASAMRFIAWAQGSAGFRSTIWAVGNQGIFPSTLRLVQR